MWQEVAAIIGAITGCLSLIGFIYFFGVWRGKVDTMLKTLWDVYVLDPLHRRPDLAARGSAFKLTKKGEDLIPDNVKALLDKLPVTVKKREDIVTGFTVVKYLGIATIEAVAREIGLSVQETIAILSTYMDNHATNNK